MNASQLLIVAMAEQCRSLIATGKPIDSTLAKPLQAKHLLWMCSRIAENAGRWPMTKLHRWIGFVQSGMMANGLLDLNGAKAMFDEAKNAYGANGEDQDLIDHLDPGDSFEMEIGGQG